MAVLALVEASSRVACVVSVAGSFRPGAAASSASSGIESVSMNDSRLASS